MNIKYTRGPWRIGTAGSLLGSNYSILARKRGGWVNIMHGNKNHGTDTRATPEEAHANAQLMMAAPELIAAAIAVIERWDTPAWKDVPATANYINDLRDAVAKGLGHNVKLRGCPLLGSPARTLG